MDLREVVVRYAAGEEGDRRVVGLDHLRPKGSELQLMGVRKLKIPLGGKIKVEGHGGIQARTVLLYHLELERTEGPCLWKQMATQNAQKRMANKWLLMGKVTQ